MGNSSRQFEAVLSRYFERALEEIPTWAAVNGIRSAEGKLGSLTEEFQERRERERQRALRALEEISPRELDNEQQLDRLGLRSLLLRECEDFARGRHVLEPNAPEQLFNILLFELQRGDDEPGRAARNLRSLLKQTPRFLKEAAGAVRTPEAVWLKLMQQAAAGSKALFDGIETFLKQTEPQPGDAMALRAAARAVDHYRKRVEELPLAPAGSFAIGAVALQRRVRDELGLDYSLREVESLALGEVQRVGRLLKEACARFGGKRAPEEIIEEARRQWHPDKPLLEIYQGETRRVAEAFRKARMVTFPQGEELQVKPVPEFLRTLIPTAAYNQPGAFEKRQKGIFWVNDLSLTKHTEAEKLAEQQQHFGIPLTCAHEAYPGHHLQFVAANRHSRKWRRLFAHAVFYEGWTLWCEQMVVDLKVDPSPWLGVQQLHDALWRCHRILVDLRLQTGRYSHRQAVSHLCRHLGFTRARAEADVNWYTAQPAVPMGYWLGRLENERLARRLMEGRGWSLQRFNDWLIGFGTIPQGWIEKYGLD